MGFFDEVKALTTGQKAYRTHVAANRLANEGRIAEAKAQYDKALGLYERAAGGGLDKPEILLGYAILLMRTGEIERAGEQMRAVSRMQGLKESDWFDLRLNYAVYHWKQGRLDEAIETARRAAKVRKNAAIYTVLGIFLTDKARETGDFGEAEAFNAEAMEYDDEDAGILDNMGCMFEAMAAHAGAAGDAERAAECRAKARTYFAKAHEVRPRQISTIYALAKMYHEDGDDAAAREVLASAVNLYYSGTCPVSEDMMNALIAEVG